MTAPEDLAPRRDWTTDEVHALALELRTWGDWGPDDEIGAAHWTTPETVRHAATLVRRGVAFPLALPLDRTGPQTGRTARVNPQHVMLRHGGDLLADGEAGLRGMRSTDDAVYLPLQAGTQWDAFCHIFYDGQTYNGRGPETVTSAGASVNSITRMADRSAGRGVLVDLPRLVGREHLEPGEAVQDSDLERWSAQHGVEIGAGDTVLLRTGHLARRRAEGWGDYVAGPAPGLGLSGAAWLARRRVSAVAADTWGMEVLPSECPDISHPVHVVLMVNAGVRIGEIWDLDDLAADCAEDGVPEFLLVAPPLPITGAVGSPLNPLAIK
ncbi:cyclase family protein [Nocardioides zeae]|uniref:Cyclase family protein n=1 Tax=Nocardioides imazamoxiresistens TaxID=3231893 RepID=A0ABU3PSK4_9ACTN|nr:cyclase family protein [Nocardioides zeae]MDT9592169.1 cyclase family protein [Nocardioides zeae]